ncbi:MAG: 50S ribosomal protein L21 [Flavobacteriaceae bacterium]|nr:50S ribosomal protein L21 [Flavobacteriaceae bacterium]MCY4217182.1 50S ribosomal protein L21 [Flavobacteriaceae bacterium]MCY4254362.1 50S ribosomal protein L21 [Flavobacteriaceae bacterium]
MYAIVDILGKQYKVQENQQIFVDRMDLEKGKFIDFENIYLLDDTEKISVGTPTVKDAIVTAEVLGHQKGDKVIVFKKKRRKGYAVKNGHRQNYTQLLIKKIKTKFTEPPKETAKIPFSKSTKVATN